MGDGINYDLHRIRPHHGRLRRRWGGGGGGGGGFDIPPTASPSPASDGGAETPVATRLGFTVHPSDVTAGDAMASAVKVAVQDASGNTVTTATDSITVVLDPNDTGAVLSGNVTKPAVNGVATFDDLSLNRAGN